MRGASFLTLAGLLLVAVEGWQLPGVCLCELATDPYPPLFRSCQLRPASMTNFSSCAAAGVTIKTNVTLTSGEGALACACLASLPRMNDLGGFVATEVTSASWAVLFGGAFDPTSRFIDQYTDLEYLYGDNAEILVSYRSADGSRVGTNLRRSVTATGSAQTFWYGWDPSAEVLWK